MKRKKRAKKRINKAASKKIEKYKFLSVRETMWLVCSGVPRKAEGPPSGGEGKRTKSKRD